MTTPIRASNNSRAIATGQYIPTQNTRPSRLIMPSNNSSTTVTGQLSQNAAQAQRSVAMARPQVQTVRRTTVPATSLSPDEYEMFRLAANNGDVGSAERLAADHDRTRLFTRNLEEKDTHSQMSEYYRNLAKQNSQNAAQAQRSVAMAGPRNLTHNEYNGLNREALNGNSASAEVLAVYHNHLASITNNADEKLAHKIKADDYNDLARKISQKAIAVGIHAGSTEKLAQDTRFNHVNLLPDAAMIKRYNVGVAQILPKQTPQQSANPIAKSAHNIQAQRNVVMARHRRAGVAQVLSRQAPEQQLKTIANNEKQILGHAGRNITTATRVKGRLGRFLSRMIHVR